jgi:membrane-associated phospholipid phosphatase
MRRLWPRWTLLPPLPFVAWPLYVLSRGERRWEVVVMMLLGIVLPYASAGSKRLFLGIYPLGLVGVLYDAMRFVKNAGITPERVHVCDLRAVEAALFGVRVDGELVTVHDWFQAHSSPVLDVIAAVPYGTFLGAAVLFAVYLYKVDFLEMRRFTMSFLVLNVLGFCTYHLFPAAPPWYFHQHGCAVDLMARASEGPNLARVDRMLGFSYFGGFYGRSNDVFGAVPSLHVAYPLLIVLQGWPTFRAPLRAASVLFFLTMAFAAVYLDHHWIIDVVVGIAYAIGVFFAMRWVWARRARTNDAGVPLSGASDALSMESS